MALIEAMTLDQPSDPLPDLSVLAADEIRDVIQVAFLFSIIDRLADSFDFELPSEESHRRAAHVLLRRGYKIPRLLREPIADQLRALPRHLARRWLPARPRSPFA
jgi:hypothetical protein